MIRAASALRRWAGSGLVLALVLVAAAPGLAGTPLRSAAGRLEVPVATFKSLREAGLVRQGWDISCGSAALSTVLTHHHGDPYSEASIAVSMLKNTDPAKVRARGGFSLLDLKRFAEAVGYTASGYGGLTLKDLAQAAVPAILPVRIRDYDHFVVFRGLAGRRVFLGDPAFGNITLSRDDFAAAWTSGIGFFVFADAQQGLAAGPDGRRSPLAPNALSLRLPDLDHVYRRTRAGGPLPPARLPDPRLPAIRPPGGPSLFGPPPVPPVPPVSQRP